MVDMIARGSLSELSDANPQNGHAWQDLCLQKFVWIPFEIDREVIFNYRYLNY